MMTWYWEAILALAAFNIAFVAAALLRSVIVVRRTRSALEERQSQVLPQESILRFLASLSLAEGEKTRI